MHRRRRAGRLGRQPGPPRRRGRVGPGVAARRRHRDPAGGPAHPADPAGRRASGACCWPTPARPTSAWATSTPRWGPTCVGVRRLAEMRDAPLDEVVAYGERRMRAALAALPDGTWRAEDVLDSTGAAADQQRPARIVVTVTVAGDEVDLRLHRHRPPGPGQRQRGGGGDGLVGGLRPALGGRPHDPGQRRCAAAGHGRRPRRHARGGPAAGRRGRRQRRGEPAGGRRVPRRPGRALPRPGARRRPGDDEQPAGRRRRLGLLRDGGRRAGRPPDRAGASPASTPA